ncbi:MAG: Ig-like domain-containing protein, partial [Acidimicrobiia bacterium]
MRRYHARHLARKVRRVFTPTRAWALGLSFVIITSTVSWADTIDTTDAYDDSVAVAGSSGANPIDVLANDTVAAGGTLMITEVTGDFTGTVTIADGGSHLSYEPAAEFCVDDSFTYRISDGLGGTDTAIVGVSVTCLEPTTTATVVAETTTTTETTTPPPVETTTTTAPEPTTTTTAPPEPTTTLPETPSLDLSTAANLIVKLVTGLTEAEQAAVIESHGGVETSAVAVLRLHMVAVAPDTVNESIA